MNVASENTRRVRPRPNNHLTQQQKSAAGGAGLTYSDLLKAAPAQPAAPETHVPIVSRAFQPLQPLLLVNHMRVPIQDLPPHDAPPAIEILNENRTAGYAFARIISVLKHDVGWGEVWSCLRYSLTENAQQYQAPPPGEFVAVKKLNKQVVDRYLRGRGNETPVRDLQDIGDDYIRQVLQVAGRENPYREMSRMDELGDNVHVLRQIEFLQDDDFVYIAMPHACQELGSLDQVIFGRHRENLTATQCQGIFCQILRILAYLERKHVHHRDLSPDNFIFLDPDNLVAMDFAMSVRVPVHPETGHRTLMKAMGRFGTPAFMSPEVYHDFQVFDSVAADLWSAVHILYCLLTRLPLYHKPDANVDILYRYYIVAGAITNMQLDSLIAEVLSEVFDRGGDNKLLQKRLLHRSKANMELPPDAATLFHHMFQGNPARRWTLAQVMESNFCKRPQN